MNQRNNDTIDLLKAINWENQPPEAFCYGMMLARESHAPLLAAMLAKQGAFLYPEHGLIKVFCRFIYSGLRERLYKRLVEDG